MKKQCLVKIGGLLGAVTLLATSQAMASFNFDLVWGNTAISGYSGPYAHVVVDLTDATHATITFTSQTVGGNIYLMGDGGSVAVNVNASSWTLGTITGSNAGTGFTPGGPYSDGGNANVDGFGTFNQTINTFDGFTHSSDMISFDLTNTGGTWASASDVLTKNSKDAFAAAHIFVTSSPADAGNTALATGYAAVPEPTTVIAGNPDHKRHYRREQLRALLQSFFPEVRVHYIVRGGRFRRWGLKSWSPKHPVQTLLSMLGNVVNGIQSADGSLAESPIGTHHLLATARKPQ